MNPLFTPFGTATKKIVGINFAYPTTGIDGGGGVSTGNPTPQPSNIYSAPQNAMAYLRGFAFGPAGALVYVAFNIQALTQYPGGQSGEQHGMFPDSMVVPCGSPWKLPVNAGQSVWGMASQSPNLGWGAPDDNVFLTFSWELFEYEGMPVANGGYDLGAGDVAGGITGPVPGWRKRGLR